MLQIGLCIEMVFNNLPFEQRLEQAVAAGYKNVEMWFVDGSFKGTAEEMRALMEKNGVTLTNTTIGSPDGKIGGGLTDPANRDEWLARARMVIDYTKAAGSPATIVCTGNEVEGMSDAEMQASVIEGLKPTVEMAEEAGVTLLLESLNTTYNHAGYWLDSSDRGAEICRALKSDRMKLLYDCYHMQIMEGDLLNHIERNLDVIGHFHAAGVPGRHELDRGEIDYAFVAKRIEEMGYKGTFGLEYSPAEDHMESAKRMLKLVGGA